MTTRRFSHDVPNRVPGTRRVVIRSSFGDGNYLLSSGETARSAGASFIPGDTAIAYWSNSAGCWLLFGGESITLVFYIAGELTTGDQAIRLHAPCALTTKNVTATVNTAPTGASLIVDVNKDGTTMFTTQGNRPTITAGNQDDLSSVPDVTGIAKDDVITIAVDQVGSTIPGSDLVVQVRCAVAL